MKHPFIYLWRKITFYDKRVAVVKKARWEEFIARNQPKIASLPLVNGVKTVPAVWDPRIFQWQWVDRDQRRRAEKLMRKSR